ncbi:hypothetical protein K1W54_28045 [Micromonospora sp. CPCC 205371]|nr:hypothetical protein [Micromonospora sp. CPCC 205371]
MADEGEEAIMDAVVVTVSIEPGHEAEGIEYLHANVLPGMKQVPGLVSGYWLEALDGQGITVLLFESRETAQAAAEALPNVPRAAVATLGTVEVRKVVAHI